LARIYLTISISLNILSNLMLTQQHKPCIIIIFRNMTSTKIRKAIFESVEYRLLSFAVSFRV